MQFQSHYNRFLLSLEGTKNIYVSFCENIISFCAPRTFRFADYIMALAVQPIVGDNNSYMVAEIDSKLLKVMNALGFVTEQLGESIYYLTSETVPISSSKQGVMGFYSKYSYLCGLA